MGIIFNRSRQTSKNPDEFHRHRQTSLEKIDSIEQDQLEKIKFNVGGEIFQVSKLNIENSKYNSYFKNILKLNSNENNVNIEIFLDRSSENFPIILQILRISILFRNLNKNELKNFQIRQSIQSAIKNPDSFNDDLKFYFSSHYEEILEDFELKKVLIMKDLNNEIENYEMILSSQDNILDYMFYRATDLRELGNTYCRRGFFFQSGGGLKIDLRKAFNFKKIELRLFIFDEAIYKDECDQISIYTSTDINKWVYRGEYTLIPDDEYICTIYLEDYLAKYLKISTEKTDSKFSISYFKLY